MLSFLFALGRRLRQPAGLAVAVAPLALLVCCSLVEQTAGGIQQPGIAMQAIAKHGEYRGPDSSTGRVQTVGGKSMATDQAAYGDFTVVGPLVKSQLTRRIAERWAPGLLVRFRAFSFEPLLVVDSATSRVFDASSPEYLMLRQLRL